MDGPVEGIATLTLADGRWLAPRAVLRFYNPVKSEDSKPPGASPRQNEV
jgi:hypothetical protein